jgi:hypothetical protein
MAEYNPPTYNLDNTWADLQVQQSIADPTRYTYTLVIKKNIYLKKGSMYLFNFNQLSNDAYGMFNLRQGMQNQMLVSRLGQRVTILTNEINDVVLLAG